jgi:hypothetical protein
MPKIGYSLKKKTHGKVMKKKFTQLSFFISPHFTLSHQMPSPLKFGLYIQQPLPPPTANQTHRHHHQNKRTPPIIYN